MGAARNGQAWVKEYLGGTTISHRGDNFFVNTFTHANYSITIPGNIYLADGWSEQNLAHEFGHIWDINTLGAFTDPILGTTNGVGDWLNQFIGGSVTSWQDCRYCQPTDGSPSWHIPSEYRFNDNVNGGYGNGATADYLAEAFSWNVIDPSNLPNQPGVRYWLDAVISLQASALQ